MGKMVHTSFRSIALLPQLLPYAQMDVHKSVESCRSAWLGCFAQLVIKTGDCLWKTRSVQRIGHVPNK